MLGRDIGELAGIGRIGLAVGDDRGALIAAGDVVIDFTTPAATAAHAALAAELGKAIVIGTTGLDPAQTEAVRRRGQARADRLGAEYEPRRSTCCSGWSRRSARRLGDDWDIEILEMHHRHKVDAPSGTALALGRAAAAGRGIDLAARSSASATASPARADRRYRLRRIARRRRRSATTM